MESRGPSARLGLLTSVCLLLAFFLESFRPVLFRSLQEAGEGRGWRRGGSSIGPWLATPPLRTPGDQVTQAHSRRPGPTSGCAPSGGQHRSHTQWYLVRWCLIPEAPEAAAG